MNQSSINSPTKSMMMTVMKNQNHSLIIPNQKVKISQQLQLAQAASEVGTQGTSE